MSAPAAPAPQVAPPAHPEGFTPISLADYSDQPVPQPAPVVPVEPVVTPSPAPAPEPAPQPSLAEDPLAFLNNQPPAPEPEPEPAPGDPPLSHDPKWYREAIAKQKEEYESRQRELEAKWQDEQRQREALSAQIEQARQEAALVDPSLSPEVATLTQRLNDQVKDAARLLKPASARAFVEKGSELVNKYAALGDVFEEGYDQRYSDLRKEIQGTFGADTDEVFRSLPGIARTALEMKEKIQQVSSNSEEVIYRRMETVHIDAIRNLDEIMDGTLSFSEELGKASPFAPQNIVARLIEQSPEFKAQSDQLKQFLKGTMIPPKPIPKSALAAMTPEQRAKAQNDHAAAYSESYKALHRQIPLAIHAMAAMPMLAAMLNAKNKELSSLRALLPPAESPQIPGAPSPAPPKAPAGPAGFRPINSTDIFS